MLPRNPPPIWEGGDAPSGGRAVHADFSYNEGMTTDYDRACDVRASAQVLEAGDGWVLVLGGVVEKAAWYKPAGSAEFAVISVEYMHDTSTDTLANLYNAQPPQEWRVLAPALEIGPGGLMLMHAAGRPGEEDERPNDGPGPSFIGDAITFPATAGRYRVDVSEIMVSGGPSEERAALVRFTPTLPRGT